MTDIVKNQHLAQDICSVHFVPVSDVEFILPGTTKMARTIMFKTGKDWIKIYGTPAKTEYEEPTKETPAGTQYKQKLTLIYPGIDSTNNDTFDGKNRDLFCVKMTYTSGHSFIMGTKDNPAVFSKDYTMNKNGSIITFECTSIRPALLLE
jgi:hypothetical protein